MSSNETIVSHRKVVAGSNRNFGLVFAGFFAIVGVALPLIRGHAPCWWALVAAALFLTLALAAPQLLAPLNRLWFRVGLALGRVVSPVVMAFVYYGVVVPIGLVMRARGKDPLRLGRSAAAASYWIEREPGPRRGSMSRQF
jgi:hypothetical protein